MKVFLIEEKVILMELEINEEELEDAVDDTIEKLKAEKGSLPERDGCRPEIRFEKKKRISGCKVVRQAYIDDSWIEFCQHEKRDLLVIPHIWTEYKGDFKAVMDGIVEDTGINRVKFVDVITDSLEDALNGFEKKKEPHPVFSEKSTVLVGEWELDD